MSKLNSGRVVRTPQNRITEDRYQFLGLEQAEPNLGDPLIGPSSVTNKPLPVGSVYQVVSIGENPGERYWASGVGIGTTIGLISVYNDGYLPYNAFNRIHGLDFVGTGVTVETPAFDVFPGVGIATVRIAVDELLNQGEVGQFIVNTTSGKATGTSDLFYDYLSGNIGVGTTTPVYKLDVNGDARFVGNVIAPTFYGNLEGIASTANNLSDAAGITTGFISSERLTGSYPISVDYALAAANISGIAKTSENVIGGIGSITSLYVGGGAAIVGVGTSIGLILEGFLAYDADDVEGTSGTSTSVLMSNGPGLGVTWKTVQEAALYGIQGTQGTQGIQGPQGVQGAFGTQGTQGIQGTFGTQGIQGPQGIQGTQGTFGTQGIQGRQGTQGIQGIQGISGTLGAQGTQGIQGTQGTQGTQGIQGTTGTSGEGGTQGTQGIQGTQGTQGTVGTQGTQGTQGIQGAQGPQGIQGAIGIQGTQGTQGIQGIQGPQGIQGAFGIQGTQGTQGIQGAQGPQGIQGATGTQGIQGIQGTQGTQGIQGIQGTTGTQGIQGIQGRQGIQGIQGTTGTQGIQGIQGTTGTQGIQGTTGTQGIQGTTGAGIQGAQGTQGIQGIQGIQGRFGATSDVALIVALSDETSTISGITSAVSFRAPFNMNLTSIPRASLNIPNTIAAGSPTAGITTVVIKKNGSSIFSTNLTIDRNEMTSLTAATPAVLSTSPYPVNSDDIISMDIQIGSASGAKGLKVTMYYTRTDV